MGRRRPDIGEVRGSRADATQSDDRYSRSNRVLVSELSANVALIGPEAHHLRDVLRLKQGAPVEAFDGRGNFARGHVESVTRDAVNLALGRAEASQSETSVRLTLAVALLKGDKLADVVRPATELGVHGFTLLKTTYADVADLPTARRSRLERIAEEAARQCGRAVVPKIDGPISLAELLARDEAAEPGRALIVADPRASHTLGEVRTLLADVTAATVVTGPEGGLSMEEVRMLEDAGAVAVGLGPRILRAETAPVALAAALLLGAG